MIVECGLWYLAEYENEKVKMNMVPKTFKPIKDYLAKQKRFKHLKDEDIKAIEAYRDKEWALIRENWMK
jgi:pyruvate ferredoxin oxidoreductase beta subunit